MMLKSVVLALPQVEAFALLTGAISQWWPPERRHTGDPQSTIVLDAAGPFLERARDGREVVLGRVVAWEAPRRILLDFYIATGPEHPTEVEILLEPVVAGTQVTVRHRPKPQSAHLWGERAPRYAASWELVLAALVAAVRVRTFH